MNVGPAQVSQKLRQIAADIKSDGLDLVLNNLHLLLAALEQPMRYFAFPTDTNMPGPWDDPAFLEDMLDRIRDDYNLARIYGDLAGTYLNDDFYWVIGVEADDSGLINELMESGIASEILKTNVHETDISNPVIIWWEEFGKNIPGIVDIHEVI